MSDIVTFELNVSTDNDQENIDFMLNDSQVRPQEDRVVKGPFINLEASQETMYDQDAFTPTSNDCFYTVLDKELEFIASQATASSIKDQTKWAVKIIKGIVPFT